MTNCDILQVSKGNSFFFSVSKLPRYWQSRTDSKETVLKQNIKEREI